MKSSGSNSKFQRSHAGEPFGPTGYRPPTCGGPNSGYVCCRIQDGIDYNELYNTDSAIRDTRQQPNQVFFPF